MERDPRTEYLVLRETIARRGSLRPLLVLSGMVAWAVLLIAVLVLLPYPVAAAIPLLTSRFEGPALTLFWALALLVDYGGTYKCEQ